MELQADFAFAVPSSCQADTPSCTTVQFSTATEASGKVFNRLHSHLSTIGPEDKGPFAFPKQRALPLTLTSSVSREVPLLLGYSAIKKAPLKRSLLPFLRTKVPNLYMPKQNSYPAFSSYSCEEQTYTQGISPEQISAVDQQQPLVVVFPLLYSISVAKVIF